MRKNVYEAPVAVVRMASLHPYQSEEVIAGSNESGDSAKQRDNDMENEPDCDYGNLW